MFFKNPLILFAFLFCAINLTFSSPLNIVGRDESLIKIHLEKRQDSDNQNNSSNLPTFQWPEFDGPNKADKPYLNDTSIVDTGYFVSNLTFLQQINQTNQSNPLDATELVFNFFVEEAWKFTDSCFALTNSSANEAKRTNTLGRVIVIPYDDDPSYEIPKGDQVGISTPIKFACFERAKDGDPNVPLFSYTKQLLKQFGWDFDSVVQIVKDRLNDPNFPKYVDVPTSHN